jgi:hypothetical protein
MGDDFASKDEALGRALTQMAREAQQVLKEVTDSEEVSLAFVAARPGSARISARSR